MVLYHGSTIAILKSRILHTEKALDLLTFKESIDIGGDANG